MAGCQIHIGLLYVEFHSVYRSVIYVAYIVIVCIINFFLAYFVLLYMTLGTKIVLNNSALI